jgi:MYXO-CTERM domain-containing protein
MDSECTLAQHCDLATGNCVDDATPGTDCASDTECASGFCVDGVCCDTRCSDTCEACDTAGSVGACTPIADGLDPADECAGMLTCDGTGMCMMPAMDTGVIDGGTGPRPDAGPRTDAGMRADTGASAIDAGAHGDTGVGGGAASGGCGCRTAGGGTGSGAGVLAMLLGLAIAARRRR